MYLASGAMHLAVSQVDWVTGAFGFPIPPDTLARLNPYRRPGPPRKKTAGERRAESKAGWAVLHRFMAESAGRKRRGK